MSHFRMQFPDGVVVFGRRRNFDSTWKLPERLAFYGSFSCLPLRTMFFFSTENCCFKKVFQNFAISIGLSLK